MLKIVSLPEGFGLALGAKDEDGTNFDLEEGKLHYHRLQKAYPNMWVTGWTISVPGSKPYFSISMAVRTETGLGDRLPVILTTPYD